MGVDTVVVSEELVVVVADLISENESLHNSYDFDLVTEILKSRAPAAGNLSDQINFQNRMLIDYAESVGNRVIKIKNIVVNIKDARKKKPKPAYKVKAKFDHSRQFSAMMVI